MIETLTLITISILLLIYFRPGKTPKLNNPLVINRAGHYQAKLAPQLNLAQPFIEAIAEQLKPDIDGGKDSATQFFEVYDNQVIARNHKFYLLAISQRDGMLYFEANKPQPNAQSKYGAPLLETDQRIVSAVQQAAMQRGIIIKQVAP